MSGGPEAAGAFDPAAAGWVQVPPDDGFIGLVGPLWRRRDGETWRYGFLAEPRHANLIGVIQGGMIMTFADRALGMIAVEAAGCRSAVTVGFETQFVGGGRVGSFVETAGDVVRITSNLIFMRGFVVSGATVLASCQGIWKILAKADAAAGPARDGG